MHKLSLKEQIFAGITLFSMFFGAGNLIFPPLLGAQAGTSTVLAFIGFAVSAIGFPVFGVAAVARSGDLRTLSKRAGDKFSFVFTLIVYLSIGPCLAIPRTAGTSFEMAVTPFVSVSPLMRFIYSVVFFGAALILALNPSKLIDRLGKKLAPVLLVLIAVLFVGCIVKGLPSGTKVYEHYASNAVSVGFIDGYQTMDAIAALVYGIVIAMNIKNMGLENNDDVVNCTIKAGYIASVIFVFVYGALAFIGTKGSGDAKNGAQVLTAISNNIFGNIGNIILAVIFVIACLNTCISLICSCSEYFNEIVPKISYKNWVVILAVFSTVLSNAGLNAILKFSVPVLSCIYPIALVLIILAFLPKKTLEYKYIYPMAVLFAGIVSFIHTFDGLGLNIPFVMYAFEKLPFYASGLAWIIPAFVGAVIGALMGKK